VQRTITCEKCHGLGSENSEKYKTGTECPDCEGKGSVLKMARNGPMIYQFQQECTVCSGTGHSIAEDDLCDQCHGKKVTTESKRFTIEIQRGMDFNEHISFFGESDQAPGQTTGNLVFVLQPKEGDPTLFKRNGEDLYLIDYEIPLIGALTGFKFNLTHLDGKEIILETTGVVSSGDVLKVPGLGMPVKSQLDKFGNLFIKFSVVFPKEMSEEQKIRLLEIFPKKEPEVGEGVSVYQLEKAEKQQAADESDQEEQPQQGECVVQ